MVIVFSCLHPGGVMTVRSYMSRRMAAIGHHRFMGRVRTTRGACTSIRAVFTGATPTVSTVYLFDPSARSGKIAEAYFCFLAM